MATFFIRQSWLLFERHRFHMACLLVVVVVDVEMLVVVVVVDVDVDVVVVDVTFIAL